MNSAQATTTNLPLPSQQQQQQQGTQTLSLLEQLSALVSENVQQFCNVGFKLLSHMVTTNSSETASGTLATVRSKPLKMSDFVMIHCAGSSSSSSSSSSPSAKKAQKASSRIRFSFSSQKLSFHKRTRKLAAKRENAEPFTQSSRLFPLSWINKMRCTESLLYSGGKRLIAFMLYNRGGMMRAANLSAMILGAGGHTIHLAFDVLMTAQDYLLHEHEQQKKKKEQPSETFAQLVDKNGDDAANHEFVVTASWVEISGPSPLLTEEELRREQEELKAFCQCYEAQAYAAEQRKKKEEHIASLMHDVLVVVSSDSLSEALLKTGVIVAKRGI